MKVFISWSGERSRLVGELLKFWSRCVIQNLEPWISTEMNRGVFWFPKIKDELDQSMNAIVCLTKENLNSPWILFEAGALSRGLNTNSVCTVLIDLNPEDVDDPLGQLNHTLPTDQSSMLKLIRTLNRGLGEKALPEELLKYSFDTHWPYFQEKFKEILSLTEAAELPKKEKSDILEEIFKTVRRLDKRLSQIEGVQSQEVDVKLDKYVNTLWKADILNKLNTMKVDDIPIKINNYDLIKEEAERLLNKRQTSE